ncbi:gliding motility lipoprotein GldD [Aquimarina sp. W85]|uniref:gliding motility lipoprotein GldD n=1 Tax=Aquimarina rhodophyticola TaxID=3342246 RepID=UPI00366F6A1A
MIVRLMRMSKSWMVVLTVFCISCGGETLPKPKAMLRLDYPTPIYVKAETPCLYTFEINKVAKLIPVNKRSKCWYNLEYSRLHAKLYVSYYPIDNNLDSLLRDAQNLTQEHVVKADGIAQKPYINEEQKVYGMFYEVSGNAASQAQFYVTDSVNHFISGSAYFDVRPNYDSILPAAQYLRNDIQHLMESITWKTAK